MQKANNNNNNLRKLTNQLKHIENLSDNSRIFQMSSSDFDKIKYRVGISGLRMLVLNGRYPMSITYEILSAYLYLLGIGNKSDQL